MTIAKIIVDITRELKTLRGQDDAESNARREDLYHQLRLVGETAAFCGGFAAMTKLHNEAERLAGNTNEVGFFLNKAWDSIGGWAA